MFAELGTAAALFSAKGGGTPGADEYLAGIEGPITEGDWKTYYQLKAAEQKAHQAGWDGKPAPLHGFKPFDQGAIDSLQAQRQAQLTQYARDIESGQTAAQQQLRAKTNMAARQAKGMASMGGFDPSARYGARLAGNRAYRQGDMSARALRAGERQNLHQMNIAAQQPLADAYMQGMANQQRYIGERHQEMAGMAAADAQRYAAEQQKDAQTATGIMGATGGIVSGMATMSDARSKHRYRREGALEAMRTIRELDAAGRETDRRMLEQDADARRSDLRRAMFELGQLSPEEAELSEALRRIEPETWRYKPDVQRRLGLTPRPQVGPMTQNLRAASPVTASVVYDTPHGQAVDTGAATMQQYGMLSALGKRLDRLEAETGRGLSGDIDPGIRWREPGDADYR